MEDQSLHLWPVLQKMECILLSFLRVFFPFFGKSDDLIRGQWLQQEIKFWCFWSHFWVEYLVKLGFSGARIWCTFRLKFSDYIELRWFTLFFFLSSHYISYAMLLCMFQHSCHWWGHPSCYHYFLIAADFFPFSFSFAAAVCGNKITRGANSDPVFIYFFIVLDDFPSMIRAPHLPVY